MMISQLPSIFHSPQGIMIPMYGTPWRGVGSLPVQRRRRGGVYWGCGVVLGVGRCSPSLILQATSLDTHTAACSHCRHKYIHQQILLCSHVAICSCKDGTKLICIRSIITGIIINIILIVIFVITRTRDSE